MVDETLRPVLDAAPDAIVVLDDRGRITRANPAAERLFGHRAEALVGRPIELLVPGGLLDLVRSDRDQDPAAARMATAGAELLGRCKDGQDLPVEVRVGRVEGSGADRLVCIIRDIAERKRLGEALDRFFRLSLDMLCIAGVDGYFLRLNPAWQQTLGYPIEELLSRPFLSFVHPDDHEVTLAEVRKLSSGGDTVAFENRYRCKDGSYRWLLWNSTPFLNEGLIFAVAHDITDRKAVEDQLRLQNLRLQEIARSERQAHDALKQAEVQLVQAEKLSSLGQLVAGVAHEINNPLAYISNNFAVLRRDFGDLRELLRLYQDAGDRMAERYPEAMEQIRAQADRIDLPYVLANLDGLIDRSREGLRRIQGIVADLRDFARIDSGGLSEVDPNDLLRSTVNIIAGRAEQLGVELDLDLPPVGPITCDPGKINQVILNLLTNALDACAGGGRITLRSRPNAEGVEVHVIDTGQGIDPAIRERIFDPFFTTKPVGKGTGLGLSISYGIVREHGGGIAVESFPGRGTHFTVSLPRVPRGPVPPSSPIVPLNQWKII